MSLSQRHYVATLALFLCDGHAFAETSNVNDKRRALLTKIVDATDDIVPIRLHDEHLTDIDRNMVLVQQLRIHTVANCDDGLAIAQQNPAIKGAGLSQALQVALELKDHGCAIAFARLVADRYQDTFYEPFGQITLRYKAGAALDALGAADGKTIRADAEKKLLSMGQPTALWDARFALLDFYLGSSLEGDFLQEVASLLVAEKFMMSSQRDSWLAIFVFRNRKDLAELVARGDAKALAKARSNAELYAKPSRSMIESAHHLADLFGVIEVSSDEAGLQTVLSSKNPLGQLSVLAHQVRRELIDSSEGADR